MKQIVRRPTTTLGAGQGLLRNDHFQIAYATNDIARAREIFTARYGLRAYQDLGGEMPGGGHIQVSLAWSGGTMFEELGCSAA